MQGISFVLIVGFLDVPMAMAEVQSRIFNQKLDHFNVSDQTIFPQRYWINDDHWQKGNGAPVLLFLGNIRVLKFSR